MRCEINLVHTFCLWSFRNDLRRLFLQKVGPNQKHWIPEGHRKVSRKLIRKLFLHVSCKRKRCIPEGHRKVPEGFPEAELEAFS